MAIPSYIGTGVASTALSGGGDVTFALPAGSGSGDFLLFLVETPSVPGWSTPSGWTFLAQQDGGDGTCLTLFTKEWTSSSDTPTINIGTEDHAYGVVLSFRYPAPGVAPTPIYSGTAGNNTSCTCPSVTSTGNNRLLVTCMSRGNDSATAASSAWSATNGYTVTERYDAGTTGGNGGGLMIATTPIADYNGSTTISCTMTTGTLTRPCIQFFLFDVPSVTSTTDHPTSINTWRGQIINITPTRGEGGEIGIGPSVQGLLFTNATSGTSYPFYFNSGTVLGSNNLCAYIAAAGSDYANFAASTNTYTVGIATNGKKASTASC